MFTKQKVISDHATNLTPTIFDEYRGARARAIKEPQEYFQRSFC